MSIPFGGGRNVLTAPRNRIPAMARDSPVKMDFNPRGDGTWRSRSNHQQQNGNYGGQMPQPPPMCDGEGGDDEDGWSYWGRVYNDPELYLENQRATVLEPTITEIVTAEKRRRRQLLVDNLPVSADVTEASLKVLAESVTRVGAVAAIKLMRNHTRATISFVTCDDAELAVSKLDNYYFKKRRIRARINSSVPANQQQQQNGGTVDATNTTTTTSSTSHALAHSSSSRSVHSEGHTDASELNPNSHSISSINKNRHHRSMQEPSTDNNNNSQPQQQQLPPLRRNRSAGAFPACLLSSPAPPTINNNNSHNNNNNINNNNNDQNRAVSELSANQRRALMAAEESLTQAAPSELVSASTLFGRSGSMSSTIRPTRLTHVRPTTPPTTQHQQQQHELLQRQPLLPTTTATVLNTSAPPPALNQPANHNASARFSLLKPRARAPDTGQLAASAPPLQIFQQPQAPPTLQFPSPVSSRLHANKVSGASAHTFGDQAPRLCPRHPWADVETSTGGGTVSQAVTTTTTTASVVTRALSERLPRDDGRRVCNQGVAQFVRDLCSILMCCESGVLTWSDPSITRLCEYSYPTVTQLYSAWPCGFLRYVAQLYPDVLTMAGRNIVLSKLNPEVASPDGVRDCIDAWEPLCPTQLHNNNRLRTYVLALVARFGHTKPDGSICMWYHDVHFEYLCLAMQLERVDELIERLKDYTNYLMVDKNAGTITLLPRML